VKKHLVTTLKIALTLAILGWLVWDIQHREPDALRSMFERELDWPLLAASLTVALLAVVVTFVRWHMLVRSLGFPFSMADAFRLGFLGYLLNFVAPGSVGGDLFKAFFIARKYPSRKAEAVATVVVDRIVGLYALLLVATAALLTSDAGARHEMVRRIAGATYVFTALGAIAIGLFLIPGFTGGAFSRWLSRLPKIGSTIEQMLGAVRLYRRRLGMLAVVAVISMAVHALFALSLYLAGEAFLPDGRAATLGENMVIVPLAMVAGALPTPGGLGAFEAAMEFLYRILPATPGRPGEGLVVALAYRILTIAVAAVGALFYVGLRRQVAQAMHEAEEAGVATDV
jgi:hypothetical protein